MVEKNKVDKDFGGIPFLLHSPCSYFQEFMRAVIGCLGFDNGQPAADPPPSTADDTPTSDPLLMGLLLAGRRPPRPPISGGGGPQTNAGGST